MLIYYKQFWTLVNQFFRFRFVNTEKWKNYIILSVFGYSTSSKEKERRNKD